MCISQSTRIDWPCMMKEFETFKISTDMFLSNFFTHLSRKKTVPIVLSRLMSFSLYVTIVILSRQMRNQSIVEKILNPTHDNRLRQRSQFPPHVTQSHVGSTAHEIFMIISHCWTSFSSSFFLFMTLNEDTSISQ